MSDFRSAAADAQRMTPGSHGRSSSNDFGDFHSAPSSRDLGPDFSPLTATTSLPPLSASPASANFGLDDNDLLGSFDDLDSPGRSRPSAPRTAGPRLPQLLDLTDEDPLVVPSQSTTSPQTSSRPTPTSFKFPDSAGSSPTRLRYMHPSRDYPGPSSPPKLTDAGADIVFHAPPIVGRENAARRMRRMSNEYLVNPRGHVSRASSDPSRQSNSLVDALATTKLAARWKRSTLNPAHVGEAEPPSKTAIPINVSHTSPFASIEQIAGSYTAPTGTPGFRAAPPTSHSSEPPNEWLDTQLSGRRDLTAPVLDISQAQALRGNLPPRQRIGNNWSLLFSLDQHGASLSTLYRLVETYAKDHKTAGNILVVRDTEGHTFGVYLNEPILKREGTYYGSGESFMFKFVDGESQPRVYRWTGRNQYVALCETGFISFGGGGTSYGLLLDSTFSRNSSATSPAFQNEVLCGTGLSDKGQPFDCLGLEVWATS